MFSLCPLYMFCYRYHMLGRYIYCYTHLRHVRQQIHLHALVFYKMDMSGTL